jgi:hypothetical protein
VLKSLLQKLTWERHFDFYRLLAHTSESVLKIQRLSYQLDYDFVLA